MIRYLLLVYILSKRRLIGPVGPLFRELAEDQSMLMMAQTLWTNVKELIIRSSDVLCYKIEPDILFHFKDHLLYCWKHINPEVKNGRQQD